MEVLAIVPARGGSKGIPHKNIAPCAGKPLVQWTFDALAESSIKSTVLSSDDAEILAAAPDWVTPRKRPAHLATDEATTESVIEHALQHILCDIVVLLQPTSPVRTGEQIDKAVKMLIDKEYDSVLSVVPSHAFLWGKAEGALPFAFYNFKDRRRRQDLPPTFEENGSIYVFTREHWERTHNRLGGKIGLYVMGEESRIQIDTPLDLFLVEQILRRREYNAHS